MHPMKFHKSLTIEKWHAHSACNQILMIACELNRAQNALLKSDSANAIHAWERAFELTDLTIEDPKWSIRRAELLRFREKLGEIFITPDAAEHALLLNQLITLDSAAYRSLH
jgi:hypothetical protein